MKYGKWETYIAEDGYEHKFCSNCGVDAIFTVLYEPDYDEGLDGEMRYCGERECGISEFITRYCPECGSRNIIAEKWMEKNND